MSKDLEELLAAEDEEVTISDSDELDNIIESNRLRISHFTFFRDLDLIIFILSNRKVIQSPMSSYPVLQAADDYQLNQYVRSASGIHWPEIDADISLRGLLLEETTKIAAI